MQKSKTDWGERIATIIMAPLIIGQVLGMIVIFIMALPLILLIELSKGDEEPIDESVWYQSGGRGYIF